MGNKSNYINRSTEVDNKNRKIEQAVIATMILDYNALSTCVTELEENMFYYVQHQILYKKLKSMYQKGIQVDLVSISTELIKSKSLDGAGGIEYINELSASIATTANYKYYITELKSYYTVRQMEKIMLDGIEHIDKGETEDLISQLTAQLQDLEKYKGGKTLTRLKEFENEFIDWYEKNMYEDTMLTGFDNYDDLLGGIKKGDLTIIAARPGTGKTALALNIGHSIAKEHKHVGFFSMEMTTVQIYSRLVSSVLNINNEKIQNQTLSENEMARIVNEMDKINNNNFFIDDSSTQTIEDIEVKVRRLKQEHGCDIIFIDYLQKIYEQNERINQNEKLSKIVQHLKKMAKDMNIAVVAIAQLNRGSEYRSNKRPVMSDIRGSGVIEQEADNIILLHRQDLYTDDKGQGKAESNVECIVDKQRNGESGVFNLCFDKPLQKFRNWSTGNVYDNEF
jgi:replicative DNA helicase